MARKISIFQYNQQSTLLITIYYTYWQLANTQKSHILIDDFFGAAALMVTKMSALSSLPSLRAQIEMKPKEYNWKIVVLLDVKFSVDYKSTTIFNLFEAHVDLFS